MEKKTEQKTTLTASCRLNKDQMKLLEGKAKEKGLPRSMLIKHIILEYLEKDLVHENLLQAQMLKTMEKVDKLSSKVEFFQQMFYSWLLNWFASHPKQEDPTNKIINAAFIRRKTFANNFANDVYNDATELFETLFANNTEDQEDND